MNNLPPLDTITSGPRSGAWSVADPRQGRARRCFGGTPESPLVAYLRRHTRRFLEVSTAHVCRQTHDAACTGRIPWAETLAHEHGFVVYSNSEPFGEGYDDLRAVLDFARSNGFSFVLFDADIEAFDTEVTGLPVFSW